MQLDGLRRQVRAGRRRSLVLAVGIAVALLLGIGSLATYYAVSVYEYAELDPAIQIRRDAVDMDRLALVYRPTGSGKVGFRRTAEDRETELLDRVIPDEIGKEQTFQWKVGGPAEAWRCGCHRHFLVTQGDTDVARRRVVRDW